MSMPSLDLILVGWYKFGLGFSLIIETLGFSPLITPQKKQIEQKIQKRNHKTVALQVLKNSPNYQIK